MDRFDFKVMNFMTHVGVLPHIELVHLNMTSLRSLLSPDPATGSLTRP